MGRTYLCWEVHPIRDGRKTQDGRLKPNGKYERSKPIDAHPSPCVLAEGLGPGKRDGHWLEHRHDEEEPPVTDPTIAHPDKPEYAPPSMGEVRATPWNGLTAISTFSGCGGSSTGYRMAGYRVLVAVEFVPAAQESYALNMAPYTKLVRGDVREQTGAGLLELAGLEQGELDLFDGSPPCEPFSSAGGRDKTWNQQREYSGQKQRTDNLFYEYARLVGEIQPRVFIAENVEGLVRGRAKGYFKRIHKRLAEQGYAVAAAVLDAQWLGVPQERHRLIFCGVRNDLAAKGLKPAFPRPLPYRYTVRDALPHIFRHGTCVNFDVWRDTGRDPRTTMVDSGQRPVGTIVSEGPHQGTGFVEAPLGSGARFTHDTGGRNQAADAGERDRSGEPCPAITGDGRNATHYAVEEPRVVHETHGQFNARGDVSDLPAPCVRSRPADLAVETPRDARVVHDVTHGQFHSAGDVSDRAAPCVQARREQSSELIVEEAEPSDGGEAPRRPRAIHDRAQGFNHSDDPADVTDRPAPTIVSGGGSAGGGQSTQIGVEHESAQPELDGSIGYERRKFTIPELKAICGFPPDYRLHGAYGIQWERLGDCVPPLMMRAIASAVRDEILLPAREQQAKPRKKRPRR